MARQKKADAAAKAAKAEILANPPKPERDWTEIVHARTEDPQKRAALLLELARLDELERACRPLALDGIASAARIYLDVTKQRARLLGLTSAELADGEGDGAIDGEVDRVRWTNAEEDGDEDGDGA